MSLLPCTGLLLQLEEPERCIRYITVLYHSEMIIGVGYESFSIYQPLFATDISCICYKDPVMNGRT